MGYNKFVAVGKTGYSEKNSTKITMPLLSIGSKF